MAGINIDHEKGKIEAGEDYILRLGDKGAVKLGNGKYLTNNQEIEIAPRPEYEGCIRYNEDTKSVEYNDGFSWIALGGDLLTNDSIIWGLLF